MATQESEGFPLLKEIFNADRLGAIAVQLADISPSIDTDRFLEIALNGLDELSIMERLRHVAESLHQVLPEDFGLSLIVLRDLAPRINHNFASMVLPEYVSLYGLKHFDLSMDALAFFTTFGSSEFAIRHFLVQDLKQTLAVMETWADSPNEHVRRLASEGSRPRLPWSFRMTEISKEPKLVLPIIEKLKADKSPYVRKSVANNLNDITKDHPDWVMTLLESWSLDDENTRWIIKHALRSLIKAGNPRALKLIGVQDKADVEVLDLKVTPASVRIGDTVTISFDLKSTSLVHQVLVVDYVMHYVKKNGTTSGKVFKLKTVKLDGLQQVTISKQQLIKNFSTRSHNVGIHKVEIQVNGRRLAETSFDLHDAKAA